MRQGNKLTERIIGSCFKVHRELGPGFNERIYHNALKVLLDQEGLHTERKRNLESFI